MMQKWRTCLWLFAINIFISAFTFGGGYVVVPMIRKYYVEKKGLFDEERLSHMAAIAQSSPGAIAVNLSALAGYQTAGLPGAVISCIAAVIPPLLILSFVSVWYTAFCSNAIIAAVLRGMQAGVAALMVDLVVDMAFLILKERSLLLAALMPATFIASFFLKINIALTLLFACLVCSLQVYWKCRRKRK